MRELEPFDSFRSHVTAPSDRDRELARARLAELFERPPVVSATRLRGLPRLRIGLLAVLGAAVILVVVGPWRSDGKDDVARAAAAVALEPNTILHVRTAGHNIEPASSESWTAPDGSWRERHDATGPAGSCVAEDSFEASAGTLSAYDARSNTISSLKLSAAQIPRISESQIALIRDLLLRGQLRPAGQIRIDHRNVTRLLPARGESLFAVAAYYVDARTSEPVRWQLSATQWYDFTTYQRLPANRMNLAKTSAQAQHPTAAIREGPRASIDCGS
jgi:hypothetical protein